MLIEKGALQISTLKIVIKLIPIMKTIAMLIYLIYTTLLESISIGGLYEH